MNFPIQNLTSLERGLPLSIDKVAVGLIVQNVATNVIVGEDEQGSTTPSSVSRSDHVVQDLPPKSITLQKDTLERAPVFGYAQLHYDERQEIIVPMLSSSLGADGRVTQRRRGHGMTPALFPPLYPAPTSPARSFTTVSTLTAPDGTHNYFSSDDDDDATTNSFDDMMLLRESHHYLLKDSTYAHHLRTGGCSAAFRKFPKSLFRHKRRRRENVIAKKDRDRLYTYRSLAA